MCILLPPGHLHEQIPNVDLVNSPPHRTQVRLLSQLSKSQPTFDDLQFNSQVIIRSFSSISSHRDLGSIFFRQLHIPTLLTHMSTSVQIQTQILFSSDPSETTTSWPRQ